MATAIGGTTEEQETGGTCNRCDWQEAKPNSRYCESCEDYLSSLI